MSLTLAYSAPEKVDTREDWQKVGLYRWCRAVVADSGEWFVEYCEWGENVPHLIGGFGKSRAQAEMHARTMNNVQARW